MSVLEKLKAGDLLLVSKRNFDLGSLPIRFANFCRKGYSNRIWTHIGMYIGEGNIVEAFQTGIEERSIKTEYFNKDYDYVVLRRKSASGNCDFSKAVAFCKEKINHKYDCKALSYFVLMNIVPPFLRWLIDNQIVDRALDTKDAYFCSELAGSALVEADEYCFDRPPYQLMPVDFKNDYCFETIRDTTSNRKGSFLKKAGVSFLYLLGTFAWWILLVGVLAVFACGILFLFGYSFCIERRKNTKEESAKKKENSS